MGRGKLPLRLIEKERARRITCAKRKKGLVKKAYELTTLCDIRVCLVIHDGESLKTFPENPNEVSQIISDYFASRAKSPKSSSAKRHLTLSDFYSDRLRKLRSESEKLSRQASDSVWDSRIDSFSGDQILELLAVLDRKIEEVAEAIKLKADREKTTMVVSDHNSNNDDQLWLDHHHNQLQGSSSSGIDSNNVDYNNHDQSIIAMPFDHQIQNQNQNQNPWTMSNLSYYTRILEASDLCSFGMGFDLQSSSSSSTLSNSNNNYANNKNNNNILDNNYYYKNADVANMFPYPRAIQYFPAMATEQYYNGAAVYDYTGAAAAGGSQEEVKFYGSASQLGFGKSSFFGFN